MSRTPLARAFTLVELLVVIAIIVILLALLVGGLERALKSAERAKCGTQVRGIAQGCAAYALEYDRTFPAATSQGNVLANNALTIRLSSDNLGTGTNQANQQIGGDPGTNAQLTEAQSKALAVGIGHLVAQGRLAGTSKGGEALTCPSLDTSSAGPAKVGMDEAQYDVEDNPANQPNSTVTNATNNDHATGASFWTDKAQNNRKVMGSYHYRALSYAGTHSNGTIRTNIAKATFVIASDTLSMSLSTATPPERWGRLYHHLTGWNVGYGDGHASFVQGTSTPDGIKEGPQAAIKNDTTKPNSNTDGFLEEVVVGDQTRYPGPAATGVNSNDTKGAAINGITHPGTDEAVFKYLGGK